MIKIRQWIRVERIKKMKNFFINKNKKVNERVNFSTRCLQKHLNNFYSKIPKKNISFYLRRLLFNILLLDELSK